MVYRSKVEEEEEDGGQKPLNVFRNDGSFLAMFKKMQEKQQKDKEEEEQPEVAAATSSSTPKAPLVGKRRGGRVLPTGRVKKAKLDADSADPEPKDAWSVYLAEVRRYKETTCEEDGKTRPLVK